MSSLILIRHGQASFQSDDYDRLSELGHQQSRMLGEHWVSKDFQPDLVFTGPHRRHHETAQGVLAAYREHERPFPDIVELAGLAEFPWDMLMAHTFGELREQDREVAALATAYTTADDIQLKRKTFQRLFERVCHLWVAGVVAGPEILPWDRFVARTIGAVEEMKALAPPSSRLVAFTSGGPVAVACLHALEMPGHKALDLVHTLRNAALTEFLFSEDRFSLSTFNDVVHLPHPPLWTYR